MNMRGGLSGELIEGRGESRICSGDVVRLDAVDEKSTSYFGELQEVPT